MSSRMKRGSKPADRLKKVKKGYSPTRPSSSTVAQQPSKVTQHSPKAVKQPPKKEKDEFASEAQAMPSSSRLTELELELHDEAASYFQGMSITERATKIRSSTQPITRGSSPVDNELTLGIGLTAVPGEWSFPNSAPDPGQYLTSLKMEDFRHKEMAEKAHTMKSSYDKAVDLQPSFEDSSKRCTTTGCYKILKERHRTQKSYDKLLDRYERMIEDGVPRGNAPSIDYGRIMKDPLKMRLGICGQQTIEKDIEKGFEIRAVRRMHLEICIAPAIKETPPTIADLEKDLEFCSKLVNEYETELTEQSEFLWFKTSDADSLVVHGADMKYKEAAMSRTSVFFWKIFEDLTPGSIVLAHSIGLSTLGRSQKYDHLKGSSGLFRSLCTQLLAHETLEDDLDLLWLTNQRLHDAKQNRPRSLALFFRDLMLDVAESAARLGIRKSICVLVDGIDRLEKDKTLPDVISVFRGLADEIAYGPLKSNLHFQYILLHPQVSRLAMDLQPTERHIFLQPNIETQSEKEKKKGSTGKKKPSKKAKREKAELEEDAIEVEAEYDEETMQQKHHELVYHVLGAQRIIDPRFNFFVKAEPLLKQLWAAAQRQKTLKSKIESELQSAKLQIAKSQSEKSQSPKIPRFEYSCIGDGSPLFPRGKVRAIELDIWLPSTEGWTPSTEVGEYAEELATREARRLALCDALYGPERHASVANEIHYDRKKAQEAAKQAVSAELVQVALEHPDMIQFQKPLSAGLILHGVGANWDNNARSPLTQFAGLLSAPSTPSPGMVRLTYVAGLDLLNDPASKQKKVSGTEGCLRQLCIQLLQHPFLATHGLNLSWIWDPEGLNGPKNGGPGPPSLPIFSVFRLLLHDVAHLVHDNDKLKRQTIEVIIDGAHWIEREPGFTDMMGYFRTLNEEIRLTELGQYIRFR